MFKGTISGEVRIEPETLQLLATLTTKLSRPSENEKVMEWSERFGLKRSKISRYTEFKYTRHYVILFEFMQSFYYHAKLLVPLCSKAVFLLFVSHQFDLHFPVGQNVTGDA